MHACNCFWRAAGARFVFQAIADDDIVVMRGECYDLYYFGSM